MVMLSGFERAWYLLEDGSERECTVVTVNPLTGSESMLLVIDRVTGERLRLPAERVFFLHPDIE